MQRVYTRSEAKAPPFLVFVLLFLFLFFCESGADAPIATAQHSAWSMLYHVQKMATCQSITMISTPHDGGVLQCGNQTTPTQCGLSEMVPLPSPKMVPGYIDVAAAGFI